MTNEELDEARAKEAGGDPVKAARLARENWTPPEPVVDPDELAFKEWAARRWAGARPGAAVIEAYLAGARMARAQEQERAKVLKVLVEYVREAGNLGLSKSGDYARAVLAEYWGEA